MPTGTQLACEAHGQSYAGARSVANDGPRYYGVHLSGNIAETPEGFLICRNTVIGRSGYQKYRVAELTDPDGLCKDLASTDEVNVWRDPSEVFSAATLASFEGKDFTLLHPDELVSPQNHHRHSVGHVTNVRRGSEALEDGNWPMLADILVKGEDAINAVRNGARELSCGYGYKLKRTGNHFEQTEIVGNHVALVPQGRAGHEARINDAAAPNRREWAMTLADRMKQIFGMGLKEYAKDAKPEDMAAVAAEMAREGQSAAVVTPPKGMRKIGVTADGVEIFAKDCGDSNASEANPAMDQKAKDRKRMHDALDKMMDEKEKESVAASEEEDKAMDDLKAMFGGKDAEAHPADCTCEDCKAKAGDESEMVDATTGEPVIPAGERQESQFDALKAFSDVLRPHIAKSNDAKLKKAFDDASKVVASAAGRDKAGAGASYAKFRQAAQRTAHDAKGFTESPAQKVARETDAMYAAAREERRKSFVAR